MRRTSAGCRRGAAEPSSSHGVPRRRLASAASAKRRIRLADRRRERRPRAGRCRDARVNAERRQRCAHCFPRGRPAAEAMAPTSATALQFRRQARRRERGGAAGACRCDRSRWRECRVPGAAAAARLCRGDGDDRPGRERSRRLGRLRGCGGARARARSRARPASCDRPRARGRGGARRRCQHARGRPISVRLWCACAVVRRGGWLERLRIQQRPARVRGPAGVGGRRPHRGWCAAAAGGGGHRAHVGDLGPLPRPRGCARFAACTRVGRCRATVRVRAAARPRRAGAFLAPPRRADLGRHRKRAWRHERGPRGRGCVPPPRRAPSLGDAGAAYGSARVACADPQSLLPLSCALQA